MVDAGIDRFDDDRTERLGTLWVNQVPAQDLVDEAHDPAPDRIDLDPEAIRIEDRAGRRRDLRLGRHGQPD